MRIGRFVLGPLLLFAAGCFQGQRTIHVKADGSGTVVDTLVLGEQMKAMMAMADADKAADATEKDKGRAKSEAAATAMGPGVRFVSEEKTASGLKTTFAFKDVRQLKVGVSPGPDSGEKGPGDKKEPPLTFRLERRGDRSVLTIVQPQPTAAPAAEASTNAEPMQGLEEMGMAMWSMMKPMMKGLRLKTVVEVEGALLRTNSRYAEGSAVTLLDMDFDQIAADDANFKQFAKAGNDPATLNPKLLQGVKGIKVSPEPEVTIEFK